jgi:hypothetical protein
LVTKRARKIGASYKVNCRFLYLANGMSIAKTLRKGFISDVKGQK